MGNNPRLEVFQRVSAGRQDIPFDIHPEGEDKVDNKRRTHRQEGDINKPGPDTRSGDTHPVTDGRAYAKYLPFNEVLQSIHSANLKKINNTCSIYVIQLTLF